MARRLGGSSGAELDLLQVGDLLAQVRAQAFLEARLDLPDALARDAVLVADLLQRDRLLVAHQRLETSLVDHQVLPREAFLEVGGLLANEAVVLLVRDRLRSRGGAREKIRERGVVALLERGVPREVARGEPLLHLDDLFLLHAEPLRDEPGLGGEALALEPLALLLQVEEERPLRLR